MPIVARIKVRGDIPWPVEHRLITKMGFRVFSRRHKEWVIFEKSRIHGKPFKSINSNLPEGIQKILTQRCRNIVNMFSDPEAHLVLIKSRLDNIMLNLPKDQQEFIMDWMDENLIEDQ